MEEKRFPIYKFWARWNQDDFQNNASSHRIMYNEEPTTEQLEKYLQQYKDNLEKKHVEKGHPILEWLDIGYRYLEHESWCLYYFNHYTFNQFETDEEVEKSFNRFIERKKELNVKNGHYATEMNMNLSSKDYPFYCFMGAEDNWRWDICRCEHCQAQGKITIDH